MPELIELRSGSARVAIASEIGAAIALYEWNGHAVLRATTPDDLASGSVRGFACFPLLPFSNRIAHATMHWDGETFALQRFMAGQVHAIHGNGWQRPWALRNRTATRATLELAHDAAGERAREWPFPYRAQQTFELSDNALALRLEIVNTGDRAFPCGLGWHPFFPRDATTELAFTARGVWQTDATRLPTRFEPAPADWDFTVPRPVGATTLDNCYAGWSGRASIRWPDRGFGVAIAAEACHYLVVFIPEGKDFLAVEPVTHMTDAFNRAAAGERDTGTRVLVPGAGFSCTMALSVGGTAR